MSSIGLLAIALIAALYSSNAGREGRVAAAVISAVVALGIALIVTVKFVPRLASRVDWDWLPLFSRYRVTREGWIYLATVMIVVFAAINTANNLLYMVLSALLAVLALSGFLSALNFRMLRIEVRLPQHCYAGEAFPITVRLQNDKRVFPSFSLSVGPAEESPFRFSTLYSSVIRSSQYVAESEQALLPRRGLYSIGKVTVSSRYPFGFFLKTRTFAATGQCICFPAILSDEEMTMASIDMRGTEQRYDRGNGQDLYMIRDYVPSDSARHVHWKASAKTATLKTREYAAENSHHVTIVFDRFGYPGDDERFEQLVSYAASVVYHLNTAGTAVNFIADGWKSDELETILEYLALVEMSPSTDLLPAGHEGLKLSLRE